METILNMVSSQRGYATLDALFSKMNEFKTLDLRAIDKLGVCFVLIIAKDNEGVKHDVIKLAYGRGVKPIQDLKRIINEELLLNPNLDSISISIEEIKRWTLLGFPSKVSRLIERFGSVSGILSKLVKNGYTIIELDGVRKGKKWYYFRTQDIRGRSQEA